MKNRLFRLIAVAVVIAGVVIWWLAKPSTHTPVVVAYVSEDQVFSEPILWDFE